MIHNTEIEHRPVKVLFDYFERALEDIGLGIWFGLLRPGNEEYFRKKSAVEFTRHFRLIPGNRRGKRSSMTRNDIFGGNLGKTLKKKSGRMTDCSRPSWRL